MTPARIPPLALALALALLVIVVAPAHTRAQPAPAPPAAAAGAPAGAPAAPSPSSPPPDSWAGQIESLSRWVEQRREQPRCPAGRCYTLDRLRITGAVGDGPLQFEITGGVLADGPVAVPLFGPPAHVRVERAVLGKGDKEGKDDAAIGFDGDHYFLWTGDRRFTLRGSIVLEGDLALTIPGPLNSLDADLTAGAVVEGARLSGLSGATVHFSRGGAADKVAGPTVFQLARAVRVSREVSFEYRLVMRSGTDLGVVRLPLAFGEKVLDVSGASGWRVEGAELVLPTSGRSAEMTITGNLPKVGSFAPDARSAYEWWLLESDPEHRVMVKGDARQVDSAESPIPRTQATSRLLLVQRGQKMDVTVEPLTSVEVLAAVVRDHNRTLVLTERGDLVADDWLNYENNGIDYLLFTPGGRPIYLASDNKAERIMHQGEATEQILVPLKTGSHGMRVQSLAQASLQRLGGTLELPMPQYPLTASHVRLTVGLPERVVPLALLGGDRTWVWLGWGSSIAAAFGFAVGWVAVRPPATATRSRARWLRLLGGIALAGLWFLSPAAYVAVLVALSMAAAWWLIGRFAVGARRVLITVVALGAMGFFGLILLAGASSMRSAPEAVQYRPEPASDTRSPSSTPSVPRPGGSKLDDSTGNFLAQTAEGGVLEGVTPVALTLPNYERAVIVARELVTRERAFRPVLYYVTAWALAPLALLWLLAAGLVVVAHRERAAALIAGMRAWMARRPEEEARKPADEVAPAKAAPPGADEG